VFPPLFEKKKKKGEKNPPHFFNVREK